MSLSVASVSCYDGLEENPYNFGGGSGRPVDSREPAGTTTGPSVGSGGDDGAGPEADDGRPADDDGLDGLPGDDDDGASSSDSGEPMTPTDMPAAAGISITAIETNQGVSIPVVDGGALIDVDDRNAPLIRNRHMLVRVYWELEADFEPRMLDAVLTLDHGNGDDALEYVTDSRVVDGPPSQNNISGTFSFVLEPEQVTPGMEFAVGLYEPPGQPAGGAVASPVFPAEGTAPLGVPDTRMQISLTLVPYRVGGTSPNLGDAAIDQFRSHFYAFQPIEFGEDGLRLTIYEDEQSAPYSDSQIVLDSVCALWENDVSNGTVDSSEYYHSAVASNTTSGVLGVAYVLTNLNGGPRCGSNLWDTQLNQGPNTLSHEIGHNQGRPHAPCGGVDGADPGYPYGGGAIGVQGWNPVTGQLVPANFSDYMGYCNQRWISDYNYRLNANRNAALQTSAFVDGPLPDPSVMLMGHRLTTGDVKWSTYRSSRMPGLTPSGSATVSTVEGQLVDVTLYERELSEGSAMVGVVEGVDRGDDIAWVESNVFGAASPQPIQVLDHP